MICVFGLNILCWFNVNPTSQENNGVKWRSCFAQLLISTQHAPPFTHTANTSVWKVPKEDQCDPFFQKPHDLLLSQHHVDTYNAGPEYGERVRV